jgi:hypothetical protein
MNGPQMKGFFIKALLDEIIPRLRIAIWWGASKSSVSREGRQVRLHILRLSYRGTGMRERQSHTEDCTASLAILSLQPAAMRLDDRTGHGQTDSHPFCLSGYKRALAGGPVNIPGKVLLNGHRKARIDSALNAIIPVALVGIAIMRIQNGFVMIQKR